MASTRKVPTPPPPPPPVSVPTQPPLPASSALGPKFSTIFDPLPDDCYWKKPPYSAAKKKKKPEKSAAGGSGADVDKMLGFSEEVWDELRKEDAEICAEIFGLTRKEQRTVYHNELGGRDKDYLMN